MTDTNTMVPKDYDFEGRALRVRMWKGRPCVVAQELAALLEYKQPRKLVTQIRGPWAEEFMEGVDYELLTGEELDTWMREAGDFDYTETVQSFSPKSRGAGGARFLVLLTETGANLAAVKARTPVGRRLRRFIAAEVFPSIARTGTYAREPALPVEPPARALPPSSPAPDPRAAYLKARTFEKYDPIVQRARRKKQVDEKVVETLHRLLVGMDMEFDDAVLEALIPEMLVCMEGWRRGGDRPDEFDEYDMLRLFSRIAAQTVCPDYDEKLTFAEMQEARIQAREAHEREQRLQDELQRANAKIRELENALPESASPAPTLRLVPLRR